MRFLGGGGLLDYGNEEHHDHAYDDHDEVKYQKKDYMDHDLHDYLFSTCFYRAWQAPALTG